MTELYHLFFLMAPRSLGTPAKRHVNATVGRASSRDLISWEYHGECFGPSTSSDNGDSGPARFDDLAIWTGSVVRDHQRWRMFYTAVSKRGHHIYDQRVGSAVSDDLQHWERVADQPSLLVDSRWYKTLATHPHRPRAQTCRTAARPGAIRWSSPTPTVTAGTC